MDCLRELLETSRYRDITVTDVAHRAGGVPGTFYQYFPDIDHAVLAIAVEVAESGARLRDLVPHDGSAIGAEDAAIERLVDGFLEFWRDNEAVLRMVDLAALEGDPRFRQVRVVMLNGIAQALADVRRRLGSADDDLDPMSMSGTLVGLLAHVSAHQEGFGAWGIDLHDVRTSVTCLIRWGLTLPTMHPLGPG